VIVNIIKNNKLKHPIQSNKKFQNFAGNRKNFIFVPYNISEFGSMSDSYFYTMHFLAWNQGVKIQQTL